MEDMQKAIVQMVGSCAEADLITTANPNCAGRVVATAIFSMLYALPNQQRSRIHIHCADGPIDVEYAAKHRIYVYGIGDTYDDVRLLYDWHQDTFDEKRSNGAMLATAGLVWRSIGREVLKRYFGCEQDIIDVVLYLVDCWLMADIDAYDRGSLNINASIPQAIVDFMDDTSRAEVSFIESIEFTQGVIERTVRRAVATAEKTEGHRQRTKNKPLFEMRMAWG